jgi:hypothetical protein
MRRTILLGIAAALMLAPALALSVGSDETSPVPVKDETSPVSTAKAPSTPDPSNAAFDYGPGAGSPEPPEAVEPDNASAAHAKWVESIWNSP